MKRWHYLIALSILPSSLSLGALPCIARPTHGVASTPAHQSAVKREAGVRRIKQTARKADMMPIAVQRSHNSKSSALQTDDDDDDDQPAQMLEPDGTESSQQAQEGVLYTESDEAA